MLWSETCYVDALCLSMCLGEGLIMLHCTDPVKMSVMEQLICRGAPDPDPDPAGSELGSGKCWPDPQMYIVHNYDIKHHSIFHSRN